MKLIFNIKRIFNYYIFFAMFYGIYVYFFPLKDNFQVSAPSYIFIIKDIIFILMIALLIFYFLIKKIYLNKSLLMIFILFSFIYLGVVFSHIGGKSIRDLLQHNLRNIYMYSLFIPLLGLFLSDDLIYFLKQIILLGHIVIYLGIVFFFLNMGVQGRILSTFLNANNLGLFANFLFIADIYLYSSTKKKRHLTNNLFVIGAIFMTGSFQAILLFLVNLLFIFSKLNRKVIAYFLMLFIIGTVVSGVFPKLRFFITDRYNRIFVTKQGSSLTRRIENHKEYLNFVKNASVPDFLFGDYKIKRYRKYDSQYLNFLRNDGLVGTGAFLFLLFYVLAVGMKKINKYKNNKDVFYLKSVIVFLMGSWFILFNFTAFLNRFPLNFLYYFMFAFVLYFKPKRAVDNSFTNVRS